MWLLLGLFCSFAAAVTVDKEECFEFAGGTFLPRPCPAADLSFREGTPFLNLLIEHPSASSLLCAYTGMPAPTSLATMPGVFPPDAECTNNVQTGYHSKIISGNTPMQNVAVYVKDAADPTVGYKVFVTYLGEAAGSTPNTFEYERMAPTAAPTAAPQTTIAPTEIPATAEPTQVPIGATQAPATDPPATPAPTTAVPTTAPLIPRTLIPATLLPSTPAPTDPPPTPAPPPAHLCGAKTWSDMGIDLLIEITDDSVDIALRGRIDTWFSVGFGSNTMANTWAIVYEATGVREFRLSNHAKGEETPDAYLHYNVAYTAAFAEVVRNERPLVRQGEYTFSVKSTTVNLIVACGGCVSGAKSTAFSAHSIENRLSDTVSLDPCISSVRSSLSPIGPAPATSVPIRSSGSDSGSDSGGLSTAAIIGIVIGVVVCLCCVACILFALFGKKKQPVDNAEREQERERMINGLDEPLLGVGDPVYEGAELGEREVSEEEDDDVLPTPAQRPAISPSVSDDDEAAQEDFATMKKKRQSAKLSDLMSDDSRSLPSEDVHSQHGGEGGVEEQDGQVDHFADPELQQLRHQAALNDKELLGRNAGHARLNSQLLRTEARVNAARSQKNLPQNEVSLLTSHAPPKVSMLGGHVPLDSPVAQSIDLDDL